jgi:hypothetical protein
MGLDQQGDFALAGTFEQNGATVGVGRTV